MRATDIRVLLELGSADLRIGAVNDALDLARLARPLGARFTFCGALSEDLAAAAREVGVRLIRGRSRPISKYSLPLYVLSVIGWMLRLAWLRPHVVHLNYVGYAPSLACAAWLSGIPVVSRAGQHHLAPNRGANWIDTYVANCQAQAERLLRSPVADRVVVVGDLFRPERLNGAAVAPLPISRPGAVRVLFLGQLVPRKGLTVLVDAFARVRAHADLLLVGGNWSEEDYPREVRALVSSLGLEDRVHFENHRSDAGALLQSADVFVLPSFEEARPRSIIEAASLGVPVVASATGGIPSLIDDGVNGLLVPPGDAERLAMAIDRLASNPGLRRRLGEQARTRVERECRPEETARRYVAVYARLMAATSGQKHQVGYEAASK